MTYGTRAWLPIPMVVAFAIACGGVTRGSAGSGDGGTGGNGAGGGAASSGGRGSGGRAVPDGGTGAGDRGSTGGVSTAGAGGTVVLPPPEAGGAPPDDPYVCERRPPRDPGGPGAEGSGCCSMAGVEWGVCTRPRDLAHPAFLGALGRDTCNQDGDGLSCAPNLQTIADVGFGAIFASCTTVVDDRRSQEGRCMPWCFAMGMFGYTYFEQSGCSGGLLCVPCHDLINGWETGACSMAAGDAPTAPPAPPFDDCGGDAGGTGRCMPRRLLERVDSPLAGTLPQLTCQPGDVCVPGIKASDAESCFPPCETNLGPIVGERYLAGACVPAYLVNATSPSAIEILSRASCGVDELCTPCIDPLSNPPDQSTGACD